MPPSLSSYFFDQLRKKPEPKMAKRSANILFNGHEMHQHIHNILIKSPIRLKLKAVTIPAVPF